MANDPLLNPYLDAIESALMEALQPTEQALVPLYQMMQYHLGWLDENLAPMQAPRGKRLRPLICLLCCEAAGADWRLALPAAAAIELVHNFTLIHDDIEDNSATRRHRTTVWKLWGLAQGVNTGDAMWSVAKTTLFKLRKSAMPAEQRLEIIENLEGACLRLCHGQYLDIAFETRDTVTLDEYELMIAGKTASLLAASACCGALVAGASASQVKHYTAFGRELGLAFQMQDDVLGIWGDPKVTGKPAADDLISRKKTFPVLYALQWETEHHLDDLSCLYRAPTRGDHIIQQALGLLDRAGARAATQERVRLSLASTLQQLIDTGGCEPAVGLLRRLATELVQRSS